MHAVQGALAVRRERQKRVQRRMSDRRKPRKGSDGSHRPSNVSEDVETGVPPRPKEGTSMTSFYVGVVFILIGFLLIFSSMVPANVVNADWSRLLGVGVAFLIVGLLMVMVNRILSAQEDEQLKTYVSSRLARTRSGHVLCRSRNESLDFTKLSAPMPSSRRSSYRDRPGSTRSVNRSPASFSRSPRSSIKQNPGTGKAIERGSSVRRSTKKASPRQSVSGITGPVGLPSITRSHSQMVKRSIHDINNYPTKSGPNTEFRARTSSLKTGNLPTVLVKVTDDSNNLASLIVLGPTTIDTNTNIRLANGGLELPMLHSSPSAHSYQNISKLDHNNSISSNDDDHDYGPRNTEKDKLLPKSESHQIVSSSVISNHSRKPSKKSVKDEAPASGSLSAASLKNGVNIDDRITETMRKNQSNQETATNKFNSTRGSRSSPRSRTTSES